MELLAVLLPLALVDALPVDRFAAVDAPGVRPVRVGDAGRVELARDFLRSPPLRVLRGLVDFTDMPHRLIPQHD